MPTDPVCGMYVPETSKLKLIKDGKEYYFCNTDCLNRFKSPEEQLKSLKKRLLIAWIFSLPVLFITYSSVDHRAFILLVLTIPVQFYSGLGFYRGAYESIRNRMGNMDILISLGTLTAFLFSVFVTFYPTVIRNSSPYYDASAFIITLLLTGNYIENLTKKSAGDAAGKLMESIPKVAHKITEDQTIDVEASTIAEGDYIEIRAGEVIAADGTVWEGSGDVDVSSITGEQEPVFVTKGKKVVSGTKNLNGLLRIKVDRAGKNSTINMIYDMLQAASSGRAKIQRIADIFSSYFVPVVLLSAAVSAMVWTLFILNSHTGMWDIPVLSFVSVVVIACPCAIGLAAPIALLISSSFSYENGVILKDTGSLDRLSKVSRVIFDKTGTLTGNVPDVIKVETSMEEGEMLAIAASLEFQSNHPVAKAVVSYASSRGILPFAATDVREVPGKGITGNVQGTKVELFRLDKSDLSGIGIWMDGKETGRMYFRYSLKNGAVSLIEGLKNRGLKISIVTGDGKDQAHFIGETLGISDIHYGIDPEGKSRIVMEYQEAGDFVLFVGDGINDSVAMEMADAGIAVSEASDIAKEAGDIILTKNDISLVTASIQLSKETLRKIRQNIYWAVGYNSALIPIAGGILVPFLGLGIYSFLPILSALAMGLSSTSVVLNSLLLRVTLRNKVFRSEISRTTA